MLDFNSTPYFDDYDELKKFVRILFRPNKAVQTRELTQAQTILQKQVSRLGSYNFEEGSIVTGGETQLDLDYSFVKIQNPPPPNRNLKSLIGFRDIRLIGRISGVTARLVNYIPAENDDPETIYVKYYESNTTSELNETKVFIDGEDIIITIFDFDGNQEGSPFSLQAASENSTGTGSAISVTEGVRYALGFFLLVEKQSLIIDKYDNKPTARLGFKIEESIVTEILDTTLLDNALGSPNATAPGAHRYKIDLVLSSTQNEGEENFIELVTLVNGKIEEDLTTAELASSGILVELAKRTYDANGDFIVEDFKVEVREHLQTGNNRGKYTELEGGDDDLLAVDIDSGRAYVSGYEVKTTGQESVNIAKARQKAEATNNTIFGDIGGYIRVQNLVGFPDITSFAQIDLKDSLSNVIGYARVRTIEYLESSNDYRFYLFDIKLNEGKQFTEVETIAQGSMTGDVYQDPISFTVLFERTNNVAIKTFPYNSISNINEITYDSVLDLQNRNSGTGLSPTVQWDLSTGRAFDSFSKRKYMLWNADTGLPVTDLQDSDSLAPSYFEIVNAQRVRISNLTASTNYRLYAAVIKETPPLPRRKLKQLGFIATDLVVETDFSINLKKSDILQISSILWNETEYKDKYILDNGQRDGYYGLGKLIPIDTGDVIPEGEEFQVIFDYYAHTNGDFFVVDSYDEDDYPLIKSYISSNGSEYDLRNAIDFRPTYDESSEFQSSGDFWAPDSRIIGDVSYYLSRIDKIAVDQTGNFFSITGTPAVEPQVPSDPENGISLMELTIPAYTFSPDDVLIDYIERKRFTMDDIGALEKRIESLEYYTSLNLIEKETADTKILDEFADDRIKNGFVVDTFSGHGIGDAASDDYKCSIDFAKGELRPSFDHDIVDMEVESSTNSTIINDEVICLPYNEQNFIKQPYGSTIESSNPNAIVDWEGDIILRPDHSQFYERKFKPVLISSNKNGQFDTIVSGSSTSKNKSLNSIWNFWQDHWAGRPKSVSRDTIYSTNKNRKDSFSRSLNVPLVTTTVDNNKTFVSAVGPFLKPQQIRFTAKNMKPNTNVKGYFDGVFVGNFTTNRKGRINNGQFQIEGKKFRAGKRLFVLTDSETPNNIEDAKTYAEEVFYGRGFRKNRDANTLSIKEAKFRTKKLSQARKLKKTSQNKNVSSKRSRFAEPLAQTFRISEEGGCFLTSIDIFFAKADRDIPVSIEIREVEDGIPTDKALPFSKVTLEPETDVEVSKNGSVPTNFKFDIPIFVQEDTEYAIVITTNSSNYDIFVSEVGGVDLKSNAYISKQPYTGYLLRSDKSFNWTVSRQRDIKFSVNKAVFDINNIASVEFVNKDLENASLERNPIETTQGFNEIKIYHEDHGMFSTSKVVISGVTEANGMDIDEINKAHTIVEATNDWYKVIISGAPANSNGFTGGNNVSATRNIRADYFQPITSQLRLPQTRTDWYFKGTTGGSHENPSIGLYNKDENYTQFDVDETFNFGEPKLIASPHEEENQSKLGGEKSLRVKVDLSSTNPNLSPIIDLDRTGMIAVYSRINNDNTGEDNSTGGLAEAKYVTKKISLIDPAIGIRVLFQANRPPQSEIDVYYKTLKTDSDLSFESQSWVLITDDDKIKYPSANFDPNDFSDYELKVDFEDTDAFNQFAIKIVMKSTDSFNVPRIKKLRTIGLGT